jgi:glycerol-3-phosphate acyltransferase PlsY
MRAMVFGGVVLGGYLLGSCPWGYWIVRLVRHEDIRKVGSGNIGATNVWRTYGRSLGIPVIALDILKGFVPAFVGVHTVSHLCGILAGAAAMLGHWRPLFLRFQRGGKIVATAGGVFLAIAPLVMLAASAVWWVLFLATRYVSVASVGAGLTLPLMAWLFGYPPEVIVFSAAVGAGILLLHRSNLRRLRMGTESRARLRRTVRSSA